ncbi:unnamed protein product [Schistosoma mattheei]|uniref:Uncharacterized protein n=1 Tax=Schistosoma mattheei TaxID=31246 RepID=A0A3P8AU79_9TREM|nr:unnamed protein product [Schistosoma mattheei]
MKELPSYHRRRLIFSSSSSSSSSSGIIQQFDLTATDKSDLYYDMTIDQRLFTCVNSL